MANKVIQRMRNGSLALAYSAWSVSVGEEKARNEDVCAQQADEELTAALESAEIAAAGLGAVFVSLARCTTGLVDVLAKLREDREEMEKEIAVLKAHMLDLVD